MARTYHCPIMPVLCLFDCSIRPFLLCPYYAAPASCYAVSCLYNFALCFIMLQYVGITLVACPIYARIMPVLSASYARTMQLLLRIAPYYAHLWLVLFYAMPRLTFSGKTLDTGANLIQRVVQVSCIIIEFMTCMLSAKVRSFM